MDRERFERLSAYLRDGLEVALDKDLTDALRDDPAQADQLMQLAFEESVLRDWAMARRQSMELDEAVAREELSALVSSGSLWQQSEKRRPWLVILACLMIAVAAIWFWQSRGAEVPVAALENVAGHVELIRTDNTPETGADGRSIHDGEQVRLKGPRSAASLVFPDGSRLMLIGQSHIRLEGRNGKRIHVLQGQIGATVSRQRAGQRMQFVTSTATIDVIGTQFSLEASEDVTDVCVVEGRVKLTRANDGRSIELSAGSRAVAGTDRAELMVQKSVVAPQMYDVDFEKGLPPGWQAGTAVREGNPARGGVRVESLPERDGVVYGITSSKAWQNGLFSLQGGEHLNVTYKLDKPDWFQILLSARATSEGQPPIATYRFKDERMWWPFEPGQWRTVSIPLSSFGRVSDWSEVPLSVGELPFELVFTSKDNNLSLVIDRIWVSHDGPGTFTVRSEK